MAHPRRVITRPGLLKKARAVCLALPETAEKEAWGAPTFRVRGKLIAMYHENHHGDGRVALWIKAAEGIQDLLVRSDAERFFVPPYVGPKGWVGVRLDRRGGAPGPDWEQVRDLVTEAYRLTAPRRLAARLDAAED